MYEISRYSNKIRDTRTNVIFPQDDTHVSYPEFKQWLKTGGEPSVVEFFTEEEAEINNIKIMEEVHSFLNTNKTEGRKFFDSIHARVTMNLFAMERSILFPILDEIDRLLYPPLNKIKTGDFASALCIFVEQMSGDEPQIPFVLDFYNEAFAFCLEYYNTKYPK